MRRVISLFFVCVIILYSSGAYAKSGATFFAGAFYDVPATGAVASYLVTPLTGTVTGFKGDELSGLVEKAVFTHLGLSQTLSLKKDGEIGQADAVSVYLSRAQHEQVVFSSSGAPDQFLTVVSLAISLDVFTEKAAEKNFLQLESLHSTLVVGEQPIVSDMPLDDAELTRAYVELFHKTLAELLNRVTGEVEWNRKRERANAVFQLSQFILPKPEKTPIEIQSLIGDGSETERQKLALEFLHTVNQFVSDEVQRRGYADVALLSPPTNWAVGNVGRAFAVRLVGEDNLAKTTIRFFVDPTLEMAGDSNLNGREKVLGYTIKPALARVVTDVLAESKLERQSALGIQLLARVYRPGAKPKWVPVGVSEPDRTAKGVGVKQFKDIVGMKRPTTREITMDAMRAAARDLAPQLVDLIRNIADNRRDNT